MKATIEIPDGYTLVKVNDTEYKVVKEEKKLPDTWDEFCETHHLKRGEAWITEYSEINDIKLVAGERRRQKWFNLLPNKEYADAILALSQLIQLRNCYNDGWVPDWENNVEQKYVICLFENYWIINWRTISPCIFAFKSESLRDKFLDNFRDLLDKIKPLYQ